MRFLNPVISISLIFLCMPVKKSPAQELITGDPVYFNSPSILEWAVTATVQRGYIRIDDKSLGRASSGENNACLGKADNIAVSLGDSGFAIVSFNNPVKDIAGCDIAVFENSFDGLFLEFAFVEASTDGKRWVRFPSRSDIQTNVQTGTFGVSDHRLVHNLAGRHKAFHGTPFDMADLRDSSGIDIQNVNYIKIVDCIGSVDDRHASRDAFQTKINDPWPTPFPQSGFDLDAVAVLKLPDSSDKLHKDGSIGLYPNPASGECYITAPDDALKTITVSGLSGYAVRKWEIRSARYILDLQGLPAGLYIVAVTVNNSTSFTRLIII